MKNQPIDLKKYNLTPAQSYGKELFNWDYIDKKGYFQIPKWLESCLFLMGLETGNLKQLTDLEELINIVPRDEKEAIEQNLYMNGIMILIRLHESRLIII